MIAFGLTTGPPLIFSPGDQLEIATALAKAWQKYDIPVACCNVLPDHVHLISAATDELTLDNDIRKLKGRSSYSFGHEHGLQGDCHVWQQKFNRHCLNRRHALHSALQYVLNNHMKHLDRWTETALGIDREEADSPPIDPVELFMSRDKGLKPLALTASLRDRILYTMISASVSVDAAAAFEL